MTHISIIVPIYDVEEYLPRCLDSLLSQTFTGVEFILVDDGSHDNCGKICDEYAKKDARVHVIHQENGGLSAARNAGLTIAQGEWISFVDSDDWVREDFLQKMWEVVNQKQADICECGVVHTDGKNVAEFGTGTVSVYGTEGALAGLIEDRVFHQHVWNKLYRRPCLENILFEPGKTNEDEFWTYQIFGNAKTVAYLDEPLYYYFQRAGSIMGEKYSLKRLDALDAKLARQEYLEKNFPSRVSQGRRDLFSSCMYAGQMTLMHLKDTERAEAVKKIDHIRKQKPLTAEDRRSITGSAALWAGLARFSFWGTCRLKCLLKKGF